MSFRVMHYEGDKELLLEKVKEHADTLKDDQFKEDYEDGVWEAAVDAVINGDFSDEELAANILFTEINETFRPVSDDWKINAYEDLVKKTTGKLSDTLLMFENGRNFSTGAAGFGDEVTCGYLTAAEVEEFLLALKAYTPEDNPEYEKEFVDSLIDTFTDLADKKSGDLFVMN